MFRSAILILVCASTLFAAGQAHPSVTLDTPTTPFLPEVSVEPQPERHDLLAVDKSQFLKTVVEIGETATYRAYSEELLRVKWRPHDPIEVSIVKPTGTGKPPVVLFLYGYGTDPEKFLGQQFCTTLASRGFAAVGFQTALTGPRYHDRPLNKWFVSELPESIGASVHDVQLMIDYLETRGDLDTSRIGIFGQGSGGTVSILAAAADSRIKAIDLMNPWGDWPDWLARSPVVPDEERAGYTSLAFLETVKPLDPLFWMDRLAGRSLRLQQTLFDPTVPAEVREKMLQALPKNAQVARYSDLVSYAANVSTNGRMLDWMQQQLETPHATRPNLSIDAR